MKQEKTYKGMVITDLDGTLLNNNSEISKKNKETLELLGANSYCRVIATGRSVYSFSKVIPENFPIDFLIFSTGAGIVDWKKKELIHFTNIPAEEVKTITKILEENELSFMVHKPVPKNHEFDYFIGSYILPDFKRRCRMYESFAKKIKNHHDYQGEACQLLTMFEEAGDKFHTVASHLANYKVIRTTSPISSQAVWMEIFSKNVSKGNAIEWLCKHLKIKPETTLAIGNDYNDIDMLEFASESYVVGNAPQTLRKAYKIAATNNANGFAEAATKFLQK